MNHSSKQSVNQGFKYRTGVSSFAQYGTAWHTEQYT